MKNFRKLAICLAPLCATWGCVDSPLEGVGASPLTAGGEFFAPSSIADRVQALIDASGVTPMFSSPVTQAVALDKFRAQAYQKLVYLRGNVAPLTGETRIDLGTDEVRLARSSASTESAATMIAKWFGTSTGAFYAREDQPETVDMLREALGTSNAENPDVVLIHQGAGFITATRGGASFAITGAGKCPGITTVPACLQQLASTAGWTVLQPHGGSGGVSVSGVALSLPIIEMFKGSGLDTRETSLKSWVTSNPSGFDTAFTVPIYEP